MKMLSRLTAASALSLFFSASVSAGTNANSNPLAFVIEQAGTVSLASTSKKSTKTVTKKDLFRQNLGADTDAHFTLKNSLEDAFGAATKTRPGVALWVVRNPASKGNMSENTKIMLMQTFDGSFEISADNRKGGERNNPRNLKTSSAGKVVSSPKPVTIMRNASQTASSDRD